MHLPNPTPPNKGDRPFSNKLLSMPKPADIGGKRLISLATDLWVQWVTQIPGPGKA